VLGGDSVEIGTFFTAIHKTTIIMTSFFQKWIHQYQNLYTFRPVNSLTGSHGIVTVYRQDNSHLLQSPFIWTQEQQYFDTRSLKCETDFSLKHYSGMRRMTAFHWYAKQKKS
jgi:hypothetical protein